MVENLPNSPTLREQALQMSIADPIERQLPPPTIKKKQKFMTQD